MAACAWPWGRRLRWAPLLWVAIALLARFACARSVALKQVFTLPAAIYKAPVVAASHILVGLLVWAFTFGNGLLAASQAPIEEGTAEQRRPQQPTVNEVWDSSDARVDAARRVGDLTAHHRRLQQPKIDEARDASDTGTSAADGKSAGGAAAVEDPLTLSLSDSSGNKLFRRAGEVGLLLTHPRLVCLYESLRCSLRRAHVCHHTPRQHAAPGSPLAPPCKTHVAHPRELLSQQRTVPR